MRQSQLAMSEIYLSEYVSLHVRQSNKAAFHLYNETLKYDIWDIEKGYYADGEDAYDMRCWFEGNISEEGRLEVSGVCRPKRLFYSMLTHTLPFAPPPTLSSIDRERNKLLKN